MRKKRKKRNLNKAVIFILIVLLMESVLFDLSPVSCPERAVYAAENYEIIRIENPEDLNKLSEGSGDDGFTRDKLYRLCNDIDITGKDMKPIQTFSGIFDGGGHTISGFTYDGMLSTIGFFRSVAEGGEVRDLSLSVNICPEGNMDNIGGIAGVNSGLIKNCTVEGTVLGLESVGGIAGRNTENGVITGCRNSASVTGMRRTGGIAGYNEGLTESCENNGDINQGGRTAWEIRDDRKKTEEEERLNNDDDNGDEPEDENIDKLIPDEMDAGYDDILEKIRSDQEVHFTGGIAGTNSGSVIRCVNNGCVGYRHLGYKTGGIAGYERGILDGCKNTGTINGRKNTGGIAGQLEPFVSDVFKEDSFEKVMDESDKLVGSLTTLQEELKTEDDNIQERIDAIRGSADTLRSSISGYKDYYRGKDDAMEAEMREHTGAIRDIINRIDPKFKTKKAGDALSELQEDRKKIESLMEAAEKAVAGGVPIDMTGYIGSIKSISSDIRQQSNTLLEIAQNAGKEYNELKDEAASLRDRNNYFDDFLRKAYDSYKVDLRSTDDDLTSQIDTIADEMDLLNDTLKNSDSVVRSRMDDIVDSTQILSDEINEGFDELTGEIERMRNTKDLNDIFDDISDTPDGEPAKGKITSCVNEGDVITDINGGGIAGMADTDPDLFSDFKVNTSGDVSLNHEKTKLAVITGCTNRGAVTVKNDCAGGIAGSMDIGAVEKSFNFGPVTSVDGDYCGGITGKSGFMIRDSFSMAAVSGNEYVGGIAGYGRSLRDNKALSTIPGGVKERFGAVAGDVDREEETATVSGNIFVDDGVGAVNGLTFSNEASAVSYDDFINIPGIPKEVKSMTVSFIADGEVISSLKIPYGGSVKTEDYPEIPDKDDKFGVWENNDLQNVRQNTVVNAVYASYVTTIASDEAFPVFLLSGKFFKDASVKYSKTGIPEKDAEVNNMPEGYIEPLAKYSFNIDYGYDKADDSGTVVRLLSDGYGDGDTAAVRSDEGVYTVINTERDGRYLVFPYECTDGEGEFYILKAAPDKKLMIFIVTGICLISLIILIQFIRKYMPGKNKGSRTTDREG